MLVLSRKREQAIRIGDDIQVTILRVKGNCVKVGIEAPDHVQILRGELEPIAAQWDAEDNYGSQLSVAAIARCR